MLNINKPRTNNKQNQTKYLSFRLKYKHTTPPKNHTLHTRFSLEEIQTLKKALAKLEAVGWDLGQSYLVRTATNEYCQKILSSTNLKVVFS